MTTAADTGLLGVLAATAIAAFTWATWLLCRIWKHTTRVLTRLADPTPTETELIREALRAELEQIKWEHDVELWEAGR